MFHGQAERDFQFSIWQMLLTKWKHFSPENLVCKSSNSVFFRFQTSSDDIISQILVVYLSITYFLTMILYAYLCTKSSWGRHRVSFVLFILVCLSYRDCYMLVACVLLSNGRAEKQLVISNFWNIIYSQVLLILTKKLSRNVYSLTIPCYFKHGYSPFNFSSKINLALKLGKFY